MKSACVAAAVLVTAANGQVSSNLPVDVRSLQDEVWEGVQRRCLQRHRTGSRCDTRCSAHFLPRFISECTTASPGRDKNSGHRCLAATVAATAQVKLCSPSLTAEAPSRRRPTRFQMTTSPFVDAKRFCNVALNDTSFQVHRDPTWRLFLSTASSTQNTTLDNQIKQHTHRVACEIVFLPLHPDTCAPLLEERVIAVYLLNSTSEMSQMECRGHTRSLLSTCSHRRWSKLLGIFEVPQRNAPLFEEQTYEVPDDNITIVGAERFCCSECLVPPKVHRQRGQRNLRHIFPDWLVRQRRVVRWHEASIMPRVSRMLRSCINMHYYGLFRISWLRPEQDLKLFTCFCVSPCRRKFVGRKLRRPGRVLRALHLAKINIRSTRTNRIWHGLEASIVVVPSNTFQQVWFSKGEFVESGPTTIVYRNMLMKLSVRIRFLPPGPIASYWQSARSCFRGFGERVIRVFTACHHATMKIKVVAPPERKYLIWMGELILSSPVTFQQKWILKGEYDESDPTWSASEISVRVRLSFTGPTVLHGEYPKSFKCTGFWRGDFFLTRSWRSEFGINRVASEIVFQPLHQDNSAPLHEERVVAAYILNSTIEMLLMECGGRFLSTRSS